MKTTWAWALVDRPTPSHRVQESVTGCLVIGPAGIGKTTLARRSLEQANQPFVVVHGFEGLTTVPFASLNAAMAEIAAEPVGGNDDVVRRLRGWLHDLAVRGTWVIVDDADTLDPPSSGLLSYTAQTEGLHLLATMRSGRHLPNDLERIALHQSWPTISVEPLTIDEVRSLLESTLGAKVSPRLAIDLHALSGGVPLVLRELLIEGIDQDRIRLDGIEWSGSASVRSPESAARLIGRRLPTGGPALAVLQTLAIAGQVRPALLDQLASQDVLVELDAQGLLDFPCTGDQPFVRLAHPMVADALRAGIGVAERRRRLASVVAIARELAHPDELEVLQYLHWALEIGESLPDDELLAGSRLALRHMDYALAADIAGALNGPNPSAEASFFHAVALARAARYPEAVATAEQGRDLARTTDEVVAIARLLVRLNSPLGRTLGYLDGRPELAAQDAAWADDRVGGTIFRTMLASFTEFVNGDVQRSVELAGEVVVEAGDALPGMREEADQFLVMIAPMAGVFEVGRASQARLVANPHQAWELPTIMGLHGARISLLMYDGRLREALAEDRRAFAAAERALAYDEMMNASAQLGMRSYLMGDLDTAVESLELALQYRVVPNSRSLLMRAVLAVAYSLRGQHDLSLQEIAQADLERAQFPAMSLQLDYDHLSSFARALAGPDDEAIDMVRSVSDEAQRVGYHWLHAMSRLSLLRLGVATEADAAAAAETLAAVDAPLIQTVAEVVVAAGDRDLARLERVAGRLASMEAHLYRGDAWRAALALVPEDNDDERSRVQGLLDDAIAACVGLAEVDTAPSLVDRLTAREREVATLAAAGLASKEIAERLHLSPRTVDNNLRRAYTKLGINSRQQLTDVLAR